MRVLETDGASPAQAKRQCVKDAIKNYRPVYCRRGPRTNSGRHDASKRQAVELARTHPPPGRHRVRRRVLMNCVRPTPDSLFGNFPDLGGRNAPENSKGKGKVEKAPAFEASLTSSWGNEVKNALRATDTASITNWYERYNLLCSNAVHVRSSYKSLF